MQRLVQRVDTMSSYTSDSAVTSIYRRHFGEALKYRPSYEMPGYRASSAYGGARSASAASTYGAPPRRAGHTRFSAGYSLGASSSIDTVDLSQAESVGSELRQVRRHEKEQLQGLNDRFAGFIERVHELEQQNKVLEAELMILRQKEEKPSNVKRLYEQEIAELRALAEECRGECAGAGGAREQAEAVLAAIRAKHEEERRRREESEAALDEARKAADEEAARRAALEQKLGSLLDEIGFLKRVQREEISELQAQIQSAHITVEMGTSQPDLTSALREIRSQYEVLAAKNMQVAEEWFKSKFTALSDTASRNTEAMHVTREELSEFRRHVQHRTLEAEALKDIIESLEKQIQEHDARHQGEIEALQEGIAELETELQSAKNEMSRYLRDYQDLLNVKMALDIEIAAYRKLLEGEESRLVTAKLPAMLVSGGGGGGGFLQQSRPARTSMQMPSKYLGLYDFYGGFPLRGDEGGDSFESFVFSKRKGN
uniref:Neurofilament light polypeptide n=2 Tax=Petromyzon marinus TaxID=7757 RepID=A0AAJ7WSN3_PETMA|nr:neurofilament light polypeptide-like isoform X1 [Petromyzon marinus]